MKRTFALEILTTLMFFLLGSCHQKGVTGNPMADAKKSIDAFAQFWETKDTGLLSRIITHDSSSVFYGSDASERFVGYNMLRVALTQMLPALEDVKITVNDQVIEIGPSGDIAWFSEVWNWSLKMEGKPMQMNGQRLTGVLERKDGNWVFVQFHNSVPVMPTEAPQPADNSADGSSY